MSNNTLTPTPTTAPISARAWRVAHAFARAFGHDWATYVPPRGGTSLEAARATWRVEVMEELYRGEVLEESLTRARSAEERDKAYDAAGRYRHSADVGAPPSLSHTTGGGRASWEVQPNGAWTFRVHRPDGPAFSLSSHGLTIEARCEARHMTLRVVVSAVGALLSVGEPIPPALAGPLDEVGATRLLACRPSTARRMPADCEVGRGYVSRA